MLELNRRHFVAIAAILSVAGPHNLSAQNTTISVTKDPGCGCCNGWVEHLQRDSFSVTVAESPQINQLKARLGVPSTLTSCHTAQINGYVIEGHVPPKSIRRLLAERPAIRGLAVPGMPIGSPGMEVQGQPPELYSVIAFGPSGQSVFARYEGAKELL